MMVPKRLLLVCGTFLLTVLLYVDRVCISTAKEPITRELQLSDEQFGWVLAAFALGYALCQTPLGYLADRHGPRLILTSVVTLWSVFTGLTAAAAGFFSMLVTRLLFGAGEAGAFPGLARATYSWIPMDERGLVQGINFSGSRLGAAFALPGVAWMVDSWGWRQSFVLLMVIGIAWAVFWFFWFRDDPQQHPRISQRELDHILASRQQSGGGAKQPTAPFAWSTLVRSRNLWLISAQYFCSNFTFFFGLTWLFPYLKNRYQLQGFEAGLYAAAPMVMGAVGNWFAGWLVDFIYRRQRWILSRRLPAMLGYALAAVGMAGGASADSALSSSLWLGLAIFGADMTLAPSWSFCIDIGRGNSGVVSGTMNMAGNFGSFLTGLAFPYLASWTGSNRPFFYFAAGLSLLAIALWSLAHPDRPLEEW